MTMRTDPDAQAMQEIMQETIAAIEALLVWDKERKHPTPYRVRDPLRSALAHLYACREPARLARASCRHHPSPAALRAAVIERAERIVEEWPLSAENMAKAEQYSKHGWANAVSSVLRIDVLSAIRALKEKA